MKIVGDYLKKHREAKNISLEQAALVTKISASTLKAIEEANTKKLPSKSYLRGFVFSYGQFLSVDKIELERLFAEEVGSTNPKVHEEIIQKQTWQTIPIINKIRINAKTFIIAGLLILLVAAITTQSIITKYQNEKIIVPDPTISETKKILHNDSEAISPAEESEAISPAEESETKVTETIASKEIAPEKTKKATLIKSDTIYQQASEYKELIVEATKDTTVSVTIGNNEKKVIKLLSGDFHTIKAKSKLIFETQNPKAIKLIYNGVLQSKYGESESPLTATY